MLLNCPIRTVLLKELLTDLLIVWFCPEILHPFLLDRLKLCYPFRLLAQLRECVTDCRAMGLRVKIGTMVERRVVVAEMLMGWNPLNVPRHIVPSLMVNVVAMGVGYVGIHAIANIPLICKPVRGG